MAETTPLSRTFEAFDSARGDQMDGAWAFTVSWSLLMRGVDADQVREGLEEALALVRETQESPQDLYGTAREHADALHDRWLAEGRLVLTDTDRTSWPDALGLGLGLSAAYAVLLTVVTWARGDLTDPASVVRVLLLSLAIGLGSALLLGLWSRRHRLHRPGADAPADLAWSSELAEILRTRYAMSGPRVRGIVAEAGAHALESGRTVEDEFGTPTAYAARFAPDLRRRSRVRSTFYAVLACCAGILFVDEPRWTPAVLVVGFAWMGWSEARRARSHPAG